MDRSHRHGPNRLQNYIQTHETVLGQLGTTGAVSANELVFERWSGFFTLTGRLWLRERALYLTVTKEIEITDGSDPGNPLVQTASYAYNVTIAGHGNVFRYCSPHEDDGPAHHRQHHRHQYDPFGPSPDDYTVTLITNGDWPVLHEVIEEADRWYWDNRSALGALGAMNT